MQFLADVELPCEECNGTRYKACILEIKYKGKNIHDVLNMTVREALRFFAGHPKIVDKLAVLDEVGLGYVRLGQVGHDALRRRSPAREARAASCHRPLRHPAPHHKTASRAALPRRVLYILDEPTTGLHFEDVAKLLAAFRKLIDGGGSLLVIEHNLDVIKSADWVIDLGPEGGTGGGQVVAIGTPEEIAANPALPHRPLARARSQADRLNQLAPLFHPSDQHLRHRKLVSCCGPPYRAAHEHACVSSGFLSALFAAALLPTTHCSTCPQR